MAKEAKTNAMRMLDSAHVNYVLHTYDTSDGQIDGLAVARKCGDVFQSGIHAELAVCDRKLRVADGA